jgi:hypothetical protein
MDEDTQGKTPPVPASDSRRISLMKMLIAIAALLGFVTAAAAADFPRRQPAPDYSQAPPVGKMPVGKYPVGKTPVRY